MKTERGCEPQHLSVNWRGDGGIRSATKEAQEVGSFSDDYREGLTSRCRLAKAGLGLSGVGLGLPEQYVLTIPPTLCSPHSYSSPSCLFPQGT